jgi:hypothetical protein
MTPEHFLHSADALTLAMHVYMIVDIDSVSVPSPDGHILPDLPVNLKPYPVDVLMSITSWDNYEVASIPMGRHEFFKQFFGQDNFTHMAKELYGGPVRDRDIVNDAGLTCQSARFAHRMHAAGASHVQMYVYDYPHDLAFHGADIQATFGSTVSKGFDRFGVQIPSPATIDFVQHVLTTFAKTGVAKVPKIYHSLVGPTLPEIGGSEHMAHALRIGMKLKVVQLERTACKQWVAAADKLGYTGTYHLLDDMFHNQNMAYLFLYLFFGNAASAYGIFLGLLCLGFCWCVGRCCCIVWGPLCSGGRKQVMLEDSGLCYEQMHDPVDKLTP